mgnify:CR=1 FL=1
MHQFSKIVCFALVTSLFVSTQAFAKPPAHAKKHKIKKEKALPYGLQKKLKRTGELPPGWKKKLQVGEVVPQDILSKGVILDPKEISKYPEPSYSKIYKIQDKIIRINKATQVILDVLK